jgi:hypothetical protein
MKKSVWKFTVCSIISIFLLIVWVQANGVGAVKAPDQSSGVPSFAGNAQHTAVYQPAAQNLNTIHWSTTIDLNPGAYAHYGAPLITSANTILVPVKTVGDGFQVNAFDGTNGAAKYTLTTDYVLPLAGWIPVYNPALATGSFGTRLYYPGRGGTIYYIDNPDAVAHGTPVHQVFYTTLANYLANAAAYNATIFINTPITADSNGNVFFGFRVQGTAPAPLGTTQSGFARIDPNGNGSYVLAGTAANDASIDLDSHNSAPALSNDETTLYVVAKSNSTGHGYLLALDSTTLAMTHRVFLRDPRNNNGAAISDFSTASPTVAPDNDVYFGLFGDPANGSRGFLLHFSSDLTIEKTPGGFGWDYTAAIVPATMVPSYQGTSSYLIFAKYNNYAFDDGDGVNRIALLDPNGTQIDPHSSANGLVEMREVLTITGPTPDQDALSTQFPYAVREWCINTAAVNPATNSIFTPSEDGHIYRWNLATNSLSQAVTLTSGIGEPYVPTIIGPDGVVYTLNGGTLFALGGLNGVGITLGSSVPDVRPVVVGQSLTFTATVTNTGSSGVIPSGTVTFQDFTYQDLTPITTTLASNVPLNTSGQAAVTTSSLTAGSGLMGNHYITATYSGDGAFIGGSATLVQKVHATASTATVSSSPNPSSSGQPVSFMATVASAPPGSATPSGMVTFQEDATVLAQIPLSGSGTALFNTSNLSAGDHHVTALYASDTVFASSSGATTQTVVGGPTATPTPTPTPTSVSISGTVSYCSNPVPGPIPNVTLTLTGSASGSTLSDGSGNYQLSSLAPGGTYTVTPSKAARVPGSAGITTVDVVATQRHFLNISPLPPGCRLTAADVDGDAAVNTVDVIAIQRFFLGLTTGIANTGQYQFTPTNRSYLGLISNQTGQNYDTLVFGDTASSFVERVDGPSQTAPDDGTSAGEAPATESGIAATLPPGLYTAGLFGENNGTGIGLVEVYDLGAP